VLSFDGIGIDDGHRVAALKNDFEVIGGVFEQVLRNANAVSLVSGYKIANDPLILFDFHSGKFVVVGIDVVEDQPTAKSVGWRKQIKFNRTGIPIGYRRFAYATTRCGLGPAVFVAPRIEHAPGTR